MEISAKITYHTHFHNFFGTFSKQYANILQKKRATANQTAFTGVFKSSVNFI